VTAYWTPIDLHGRRDCNEQRGQYSERSEMNG
jgi:hypothetical protein